MKVIDVLNQAIPGVSWEYVFLFKEFVDVLIVPMLGIVAFLLLKQSRKDQYRSGVYYKVVTYSLNQFKKLDGHMNLQFRTALEGSLGSFVPDDAILIKKLERVAQGCDYGKVFMALPDTRQQEMFLNSLASHWLASESDDLAESIGLPVKKGLYVLGATFEPYDTPSSQKIRVMIISLDELLHTDLYQEFRVAQDHHMDRIHTLREMQNIYHDKQLRDKFLITREITKRV